MGKREDVVIPCTYKIDGDNLFNIEGRSRETGQRKSFIVNEALKMYFDAMKKDEPDDDY